MHALKLSLRGRSSVGRAPQWHCGGREFEPHRLQKRKKNPAGRLAGFFFARPAMPKKPAFVVRKILAAWWRTVSALWNWLVSGVSYPENLCSPAVG